MPVSLPFITNSNLKSYKLTLLFLIAPMFFWGQSLSGLWTGILAFDSNSVRKDQSFEIALTEYKGKVYGYSRSEFIVDDILYYIVKRVKGTIEGDVCEVKDDEIISFNFPTKLDKGVKVSSIFYRNKIDGNWHLDGKWKTDPTKKFSTVTGKVELKEEKDMELSKIFPHLEELNLATEVPFYQESKKLKESIAKSNVKTEQQNTIKEGVRTSGPASVQVNTVQVNNTLAIKQTPIEPKKANVIGIPTQTTTEIAKVELKEQAKPDKTIVKTEQQSTIEKEVEPAGPATVKVNTIKVNNTSPTRTTTEPTKAGSIGVSTRTDVEVANTELKELPKKDKTLVKTEQQTINEFGDIVTLPSNAVVSKAAPAIQKPAMTGTINSKPAANETTSGLKENATPRNIPVAENGAASQLKQREIAAAQVVFFTSDSLQLSLYDNGEIDGDTVSVLLNGEMLLAKQGLKASAIKKTIYITPGSEELTLVLYAENLGKYPPNTGLLVVHDGEAVHNIRFSADLQKNASVVFRRKR